MASDAKKAVDIALKLTGIDPKQITPLVTAFKNLEKSVKNTQTAVNNLQKSLSALKTPTGIKTLSKSLGDLAKIKLKDLGPLATNLTELSKISAFPNIGTFVNNIRKLSSTSFAGLQGLTKQFQALISLNVASVVTKLRDFNTALAALEKRGGLASFSKFAADIRQMKTALASSQGAVQKMSDNLGKLGQAADQGGMKLRTFGDKIKTVFDFRVISEGFMMLREGISSGVTAIIEYDQALKDLQAITGATNTEVAQMGAKILEVASRTKFSAEEVAAGMRTLGQAGFSAAESVQTMQAVSDLATGTLSDMSQTVDLMTTAMRVFQIDASESAKVSDTFANAVNRSKLTIEKLRTSMNYVGPVAHNINITFQETSAAMMTLANAGLRASTIGTSLRQVLAQLAAPSKKFRDAAREAGIAMQDLDPTTNSLSSVLANLRLVVQDTGTAFDIFGKRGASAAIALTANNSQYNELLDTVSRTGTAAEMAAKQMEGLGVSFKNLRDKLGNLAIALGKNGISGVMKVFVNVAREIVDVLINVTNTAFGGLVVKTGILVTAIGALVGSFLALKNAIAGTAIAAFIGTIISTTKAIWAAVLSTKAWNVALRANPIGLVITAIGALVAIVATVTKGFGLFNDTARETSEEAAKLADEFGVFDKKVTDFLVNTQRMEKGSIELKNATLGLREELLEIANGMGPLADEARKAADSIDPLEGAFFNGKDALLEFQKAADELQTDKLEEALESATKHLKNQMELMPRWAARMRDAFGTVWGYLEAGGNAILAALDGKFNKIPSIFSDALQKATRRGKEIEEAFDLSKSIDEGKASLKEIEDAVASYGDTVTEQQRKIKDSYNVIMERATDLLTELRETGEVTLDYTIEDIQRIGKEAELSSIGIEALAKKFKQVKENSWSARNTLEKWANDPSSLKLSQDVKVLDDMYKTLGATIAAQQRKEVEGIENVRQKRLGAYQDLQKQTVKPDLDGSLEEWKAYWRAEQDILNNLRKDRKEASTNIFVSLETELAQAHQVHQQKLADLLLEYEGNEKEHARLIIQADQQLADKRAKIYKDFIDKVVIQSEGLAEGFEAEVDQMGGEFSKLEQESQKAWKNIGTHSDSTLNQQQQAIGNWVSTVQEKMNSFSTKTQEVLNKLGENLALALKEGDLDQIQAIEGAIKDVTDNGATYFEQMGDSIATVLDHIASKEADLLNNIETYAQQALAVQKEVEDILFGLEQKRMSQREIYEANRLKAEELFKQAAIQNAQAENLSGDAAIQAREKAKELAKEGLEYTKRLQSAVKNNAEIEKKIIESKEKERSLRQELSKLSTSDEEAVKERQKIEKDITSEVENQKQFQEELTTSGEAYKEVKGKVLEYEKLMTEASEGQIEASKGMIASLQEQVKEVEAFQKHLEEIKVSIEELTFDINLEEATTALQDFKGQVDELFGESFDLDFSVDPEGKVQEEIVKIGDTWTNVWTTAEKGAQETVQTINDALDNIDQKEVNVQFTGSGSATMPISAKIEAVKSALQDLGSNKIEIPILLKGIDKAIKQAKNLVKELSKIKDKTITVVTKYKTEGNPPSKKRWGGRLPGYGGGDKHPVLAESGEWFIRKEAVQKYGDSFFAALNNMQLPKFQEGGRVGASMLSSNKTSETSVLNSLANFGTVNLETERMTVPAIVHSDVISELSTHLNKMRRFGT